MFHQHNQFNTLIVEKNCAYPTLSIEYTKHNKKAAYMFGITVSIYKTNESQTSYERYTLSVYYKMISTLVS